VDLCNGLDDDCDPASADGSEDASIGVSCDGSDSDLCLEGTTSCVAGASSCSDTTSSTTDVCNGVDDDCDPASADGAEDPGVGGACDGLDTDLCLEGVDACIAGAIQCTDTTSSTIEVCNGVDDDCNIDTPDGFDDARVGVACDGIDSDLCLEGLSFCSAAGTIGCSDATSSTVDLCNGVNDDCDPASADGSEDARVGAACDGPDTDLCLEGVGSCTAGAFQCSDTTGSTVEICNGVDDDCNGLTDETFVRDTNPLCTDGLWDLGTISGDLGPDQVTDGYTTEQWDWVTLREDDLAASVPITGTLSLWSPPGVDFDLYVYCVSCGGALAGSSTVRGTTGHFDVVNVRRNDTAADDSLDLMVEIRHASSAFCADWTLTVDGNTPVATATCP
jgi:hypothetical protein